MWDSPLYAVNMVYYHWLITICFVLWQSTIELGGKTILNEGKKKAESGHCHVAAEVKDTRTVLEGHNFVVINRN